MFFYYNNIIYDIISILLYFSFMFSYLVYINLLKNLFEENLFFIGLFTNLSTFEEPFIHLFIYFIYFFFSLLLHSSWDGRVLRVPS